MESGDTQPLIPHSVPSHRLGVGDFVQRYLRQPRRKAWSSWHEDHHEDQDNDEHDGEGQHHLAGQVSDWRSITREFLTSRWGHYFILILVSVDVACIFADFMIEIHTCELKQKHKHVDVGWKTAQETLSIVSLVFSCLFMLELIAATLSFGLRYVHLRKSSFRS